MRRASSFYTPTLLLCLSILIQTVGSVLLWVFDLPPASDAYAAGPPTTISATPAGVGGLNTLVNSSPTTVCSANCVVTGGTRPGGGGNLFHSFGQFNIGAGDVTTFQNGISFNTNGSALPAGLPTSNILARITGTNGNNPTLSSIYGTLQTSGFGNANLFLMNPAGFLFGPNATVNVGGMVAFTSADYLRLQGAGGDGIFYANSAANSVLTSAPVAAYGFLGSNPGAITVQGSQFTVTPGISLVGGDITIQSGTLDNGAVQPALLSALRGQINLASVASPGEILAGTMNQAPNINGQSFGALGTIQVLEQSHIDVSGNGGGTVLIRGGNLVLDNSTISSNVTGPGPLVNGTESIGNGIDIQVSGNAVIQNLGVLETNVTGNATPGVTYGGVHVKADRIEIIGTATFDDILSGNVDFSAPPFTGIRSDVLNGSTGGNSGNIVLEANSIAMSHFGQLEAQVGCVASSSCQSDQGGAGNAGSIKLTANHNLEMVDVAIIQTATSNSTGNAGNIELTSANGNISISTASQVLSNTSFGSGNSSTIMLSARHGDILLSDNSQIGNGSFQGGAIGGTQITANNLQLNGGPNGPSQITQNNLTNSPFAPGDIIVTLSGNLSLNDGSAIFGNAFSATPAANMNITARDVSVVGGSFITSGSQQAGRGGALNISADTIEMTSGGQIRSGSTVFPQFDFSTFTFVPVLPSGPGGTINIQGHSGPAASLLIDGAGSGIFTNSHGSGSGGNTNISAQSVTIQNGGVISAQANGSGSGGQVNISADNLQLTNGGQITSGSVSVVLTDFPFAGLPLPPPTGAAGAITVQGLSSPAHSVLIDGTGSGLFTNTQGAGAGGNTTISAQSLTVQNGGTISAATSGTAPSAVGGSINVNSTNGVTMNSGGSITASSTGPGNAGNIFVNAGPQLVMQDSSIKTEAAQAGGGNIEIQAGNLVQLGNSTVSTSVLGGTGSGGNITIDPNSVILQNSQILAQAVQGSGGNISITTNLLLPDSASIISASSQFGQQGNIVIQSPISPASGKIVPLSQRPLIATTLLGQRCAALASGNVSSFTMAGRDALPAEPGAWMSSPLAIGVFESQDGMAREASTSTTGSETEGTTPLLSLRKIAPPGFLTQNFAMETDCTS